MSNDKGLHDAEHHGEGNNFAGNIASPDTQLKQPYFKSLRNAIWKKPQTGRERNLFFVCIFLVVLALIFFISLCVLAARSRSKKAVPSYADSSTECRTATCHMAAQTVLDSMDTSADPCDNFYQYACGGWIAKHPIPDDKSYYMSDDVHEDAIAEKLAKSLKEVTSGRKKAYTKSVMNAAYLYQGCMDEDAREAQGLRPLKGLLDSIGGFPMIDHRWSSYGYKWYKVVAAITRDYFIAPIMIVTVGPDVNKTSQNIIYIAQASFGLGRNELINLTSSQRNVEIIEAYKNFIVSTGKLLNPNVNEAQLEKDADDLIQFESQLAGFSKPQEEIRDARSWYNKMTVAEVQSITENMFFFWTEYLNDVFLHHNPSVSDDTEVILGAIDYVKEVIKLTSATNPRVVANYIGWTVIRHVGKYTTKEFRANTFRFAQIVTGIKKTPKLEKSCITQVIDLMGFAVGRLYVDEFFTDDEKKDVEELVEKIRSAYELTLKKNTWMDEETKNKALEKLASIISMMGYPEWIKNDDELNKFYKSVAPVKVNEFFVSFLNAKKALIGIELAKWNQPTNRSHEWVAEPPVANAFYFASANSITFPAGGLILPSYQYGRSPALNFGGIGSVIGHEMSHGFDDEGSQFDAEGNLVNWWSDETRDEFNEKANCFREQYSSYVEPMTGMNLNGNNTIGENIADNGGLRNAFIAYKMQELLGQDEFSKHQRLPGVQATPEQLFFIGYATLWCSVERKESMMMTIYYDRHSPDRFRVIVPLSNSRAFSEAFNCPLGSRMNPEKKCQLW